MTTHRTLDDQEVLARIVAKVSHEMIVNYGEAGTMFLYKNGALGASFARYTYFAIREELENTKPHIEKVPILVCPRCKGIGCFECKNIEDASHV